MMSEPAKKNLKTRLFLSKTRLFLSKTPELFIALEMVNYCCFSLGGNLENLDFLQKKFYNINYRKAKMGEGKARRGFEVEFNLFNFLTFRKFNFSHVVVDVEMKLS